MLKKNEALVSRLQKLIEALIAFAIWYIIYFYRFNFFSDAQTGLEKDFISYGVFLSILTLLVFKFNGLYQSQRLARPLEEVQQVAISQAFTFFIFVVCLYFFAQARISRSVILSYFIISTVLFTFWRLLLRNIMGQLRLKGYNLRHYVVVGYNKSVLDFIEKIEQNKFSGMVISKWFIDEDVNLEQRIIKKNKNKIIKYDRNNFFQFLDDKKPDVIIVAIDSKNPKFSNNLISQIHNSVVPIFIFPDVSLSFVGSSLESIAGVPTLKLNQPRFSEVQLFVKRSLDIIGALVGIILFSPFLIITAIGVKLSSKGPILFSQERIGLDGEKFKMYKFRSMRTDAEKTSQWTTAHDPRKTKFGSFIRATSLDELPQFFNVLFGDMSLVGPRPEQPRFVDKFKNEIPAYMLRHKMKAGITGWAQVNGWRGDTSLHKRIECDLYYIRNWSVWFDIKILFLTFWKGFINKNAY